ncbi:glutathione S-transferase Mu 1 [Folsomia candida]|uniref:glutathione transferase n=1 Tax=Folsomia candida TaxID=158441 RepID=A0A226CXC5_FOLCA|nr:glutathione S-transferase Mu 1 [Folsomia candida]OXA37982.1 Glutathione S-transferase Mu 1 [Folsomia candida]
MSESKPVLAYWNFRGVVAPTRMLLAYLGVDHDEIRYPANLAGVKEWHKIRDKMGLDFPNLPYWKENSEDSEDKGLTESRAIIKHIARTRGNGVLMPTSLDDLVTAECVEGVVYDTGYGLVKRCLYDADPFKEDLKAAPVKFDQLEKFLGTKRWILGDQLFYVDFLLYEVLYQFEAYDPDYFKAYPSLSKFKGRLEALPEIRKYMESPSYVSGPCVHPFFARLKI